MTLGIFYMADGDGDVERDMAEITRLTDLKIEKQEDEFVHRMHHRALLTAKTSVESEIVATADPSKLEQLQEQLNSIKGSIDRAIEGATKALNEQNSIERQINEIEDK